MSVRENLKSFVSDKSPRRSLKLYSLDPSETSIDLEFREGDRVVNVAGAKIPIAQAGTRALAQSDLPGSKTRIT